MSEPRAELITCRIDHTHKVGPNEAARYPHRFAHWCDDCQREMMSRSEWFAADIETRIRELGWNFGSSAGGRMVNLYPAPWDNVLKWMVNSRKIAQWVRTVGVTGSLVGEKQMIANLLEIVGDPWRPRTPGILPETQDGIKAYRMATHFAHTGTFLGVSILADILEDDGYQQEDVINHLRSDAIHLPGCWALDVVLGRS